MAQTRRLTQFITPGEKELRERPRSAVLDGLRQLGYLPAKISYSPKSLALPESLFVAGIWFIRITRRRAAVGIHLPVVVLISTVHQQV